jgi:hypothetical protein
MIPPYRNAVCRGSLALGTACRRCERCDAEREQMRAQQVSAEKSDAHQPTINVVVNATELKAAPDIAQKVKDALAGSMRFHSGGVAGLPVKGYKKEQPAHLVALVNENKLLEELVLRQITCHVRTDGIDQRFVALARTKIQEAFMDLNRAVFQPQRIEDMDGTTALIVKLLDRSN